MSLDVEIARTILAGFDKHYRLFREASVRAKERFERADWAAVREAGEARIRMYDQRVAEAVAVLEERFPTAGHDETRWPQIKHAYIALLYDHKQPECAETFYNSVARRVLDRRYYRNEYIFSRPAVSTEHLEGDEPAYRCYYPASRGLRRTAVDIAMSFGLRARFQNLKRDVRYLVRALREAFRGRWTIKPNFQIQLLSSLFYRNKGAYIVGRGLNGNSEYPFVIPLLQDDEGAVYLDALLLESESIGRLFSLARAYFMVDMEVPSAYVTFLKALLPSKPKAELYTQIGLQKQGKTLFYRDLHEHLKHSSDRFVIAPGTKGMVMLVFTLPSFPYVFKVIRDWFPPPKQTDRRKVQEKYLQVKYHDRVGRMADTLEFSHVALPLDRFDKTLLEEISRLAPNSVEVDGDNLVIKHLYIERRMIPLDIYLRDAEEPKLLHGVREYGNAIKELAFANIFPGDLLLKNFGVTRYGRVVFYDYDEICDLEECNFRAIPTARSHEDEMASEPWYSVGPRDVFPEQFPTFVFQRGRARELFLEVHGDLADPAYWTTIQERIAEGSTDELLPYPEDARFCRRFGPGQQE